MLPLPLPYCTSCFSLSVVPLVDFCLVEAPGSWFCGNHRKPGMMYMRQRLCEGEGCLTIPSYGYQKWQPRMCKEHSKEGMIDVVNQRCAHSGCDRFAQRYDSEKRFKYCKMHHRSITHVESGASSTPRPASRGGGSRGRVLVRSGGGSQKRRAPVSSCGAAGAAGATVSAAAAAKRAEAAAYRAAAAAETTRAAAAAMKTMLESQVGIFVSLLYCQIERGEVMKFLEGIKWE